MARILDINPSTAVPQPSEDSQGSSSPNKAAGVSRTPPQMQGNTKEALRGLAEFFKQLANEKPIPGEVVETMKLNRELSR